MADDVTEIVEPEENPSRSHNSSCAVASILAFGSPVLFILMLTTGGGGAFIALCPILILMSFVGFIWGLVLMIKGDPAERAAEDAAKLAVVHEPPVGTFGMPDVDDEGRMR